MKGRKRHLLVNTQCLLLRGKAHAANIMDWDGIKMLLEQAEVELPGPSHLWLDASYGGEHKGKGWVVKALGWSVDLVECPRKPAPEMVLTAWAEQWLEEGVKIDWEKHLPPKGFQVLPRRWVVERTFSWLSQNRRVSKDFERLCASAEAFVYVAMICLMVRHLARG